jgi:hypothetical protein
MTVAPLRQGPGLALWRLSDECARVLKRAGAASVSVLTLARALRVGG